jgi:hypothetical protein
MLLQLLLLGHIPLIHRLLALQMELSEPIDFQLVQQVEPEILAPLTYGNLEIGQHKQ